MVCKNKECSVKFKPIYFLQKYCSLDCKKTEKSLVKPKKALPRTNVEKKSKGKLELQGLVNKVARIIDKGHRCISCGKATPDIEHGSHFHAVSKAPSLRYNLYNIFKSCAYCNIELKGNITEYEKRLIRLFGESFVSELHAYRLKYKVLKLSSYDVKEAIVKLEIWILEYKVTEILTHKQRLLKREEVNKLLNFYK